MSAIAWWFVCWLCVHTCLQIVDDSMSACEEDHKYYGEMEFLRGSDGIIVRKVMSLLDRNKFKKYYCQCQASHSSIAYPYLPMFYYLHCSTKFLYYLCYHFSSILWLRWEILPPYQSHTSPQILPMYPPRIAISSHALESSHRTYSEEIWSDRKSVV